MSEVRTTEQRTENSSEEGGRHEYNQNVREMVVLLQQPVMWAEPDVAGYLEKRGGNFATWKTRFFILQGSTLFYFPDPFHIQNPLGVLPMEGSGLEAAGVEEGGAHRKWCFRIKLGAQFGLAKRSVYVFSAPSKQAQEEWLENLRYAASTRADLIACLHKSRRTGADLRFKLSKCPVYLETIEESRKGPEGYALQAEMARLRKQLVSLNKQASEIKSQCGEVEAKVMLAVATWDMFSHHLADKSLSDYKDKLESELNLTRELTQLLATRADYMEGHRLETLEEDARTELQKICEKALTRIQEHQAKIRIKAPRYTTEVNIQIFTENDEQFKHTSEIFTACSRVTANKKLLDLQRRAAKDNMKQARSGWIISKIGAVKSVTSDGAKSALRDIAAAFSKEPATVSKFIFSEASTANRFSSKETVSATNFGGKGKGFKSGAESKVRRLEAQFIKDMATFGEFVSKEKQSANRLMDRVEAATMAEGEELKQGGAAGVNKSVGGERASLGWKALNRMKLHRSNLQKLNFKSRLLSSFMAPPQSAESTLDQRFSFNPKYLSAVKSRPRISIHSRSFRVTAGLGSAGASTSATTVLTPEVPSAGESSTASKSRKPQQFSAGYGTSGSGSSQERRSSVSEEADSNESDPKQTGYVSTDTWETNMFFEEYEDPRPKLRGRPKGAR